MPVVENPLHIVEALCRTRTGDPFLTMLRPVSGPVPSGHTRSPQVCPQGATKDPSGQPKRPQDAPTKGVDDSELSYASRPLVVASAVLLAGRWRRSLSRGSVRLPAGLDDPIDVVVREGTRRRWPVLLTLVLPKLLPAKLYLLLREVCLPLSVVDGNQHGEHGEQQVERCDAVGPYEITDDRRDVRVGLCELLRGHRSAVKLRVHLAEAVLGEVGVPDAPHDVANGQVRSDAAAPAGDAAELSGLAPGHPDSVRRRNLAADRSTTNGTSAT